MRKTILLSTSAAVSAVAERSSAADGSAEEVMAEATATVSAAGREAEALELATKADNNKDINSALENAADAKETLAMSSLFLYTYFTEAYGDTLDTFPVPGTQGIDEKKPGYSETNPDIYERPTRRKGGGSGTAQVSFINVFAEGLKPLRDWRSVQEKARADYDAQTIGVMERDQIIAKYDARISGARTKVKQAIALHHQLKKAADYPAVAIEFVTETVKVLDERTGKPVIDPTTKRALTEQRYIPTDKPIAIIETENKKNFWYYSVTQFNGLDFDLAKANGATCKDLLDTLRKGTDEDNGDGADGISVQSLVQLESAIGSVASYLDDNANYMAVIGRMDKKDDNTDHLLLSFNEVYVKLAGILGKHARRIEQLEMKQAQAQAKSA